MSKAPTSCLQRWVHPKKPPSRPANPSSHLTTVRHTGAVTTTPHAFKIVARERVPKIDIRSLELVQLFDRLIICSALSRSRFLGRPRARNGNRCAGSHPGTVMTQSMVFFWPPSTTPPWVNDLCLVFKYERIASRVMRQTCCTNSFVNSTFCQVQREQIVVQINIFFLPF